MTKTMNVIEHADGLVQEAEDLFIDQEPIMRSDYRDVVESHTQYARELREGIEKKSGVSQAKQAKLYFEQAQKALDAVKNAIEKCK